MAHPSMLFSAPRGREDSAPASPPRSPSSWPTEHDDPPAHQPTEVPAALGALRESLVSNLFDFDVFLDQVARQAQVLTGATSAAVALRQDKVVLCRANVGESSPPLGAKLNADSGISGECLRTGHALQCEDTEADSRVDRDICHRLGIRSITAVPILRESLPIGILEVFFAKPRAFDVHQLQILVQLAELAGAAAMHASDSADPSPDQVAPVGLQRQVSAGATVELTAIAVARSPRLRHRIIALAILLVADLVVAMFFLWKHEHNKPAQPTSTKTLSVTATHGPTSAPSRQGRNTSESRPSELATADPSHLGSPVSRGRGSHLIREEANRIPAQGPEQPGPITPLVVHTEPPHGHELPAVEATEPPPGLSALGAATASGAIGNILSPPVDLPSAALPVFQGVSGGSLERSVQPVYPREALALRLEGLVVLQVEIDEEGKVRVLKVLSGDPILARAAMDAVIQWRYHPYLLNGHPVKREARITLTFTLP